MGEYKTLTYRNCKEDGKQLHGQKKKKGRKITIIVSLFSIFVYVEFCLLLGFKQSFVNNVNNDATKNGAPLRKKMRIWQFPT